MLGFRRFSESDWYGLAGAERFATGAEPVIAEGTDFFVCVDKNSAQIFFGDDEDEIWGCPNASAVFGLEPNSAREDMAKLGFQRIN